MIRRSDYDPPYGTAPPPLSTHQQPCQVPGAHGETVCVRRAGQEACDDCPTPFAAELEAVAGGLDPEQEIRARALDAATELLRRADPPVTSSFAIAYATDLAGWIRTGDRS